MKNLILVVLILVMYLGNSTFLNHYFPLDAKEFKEYVEQYVSYVECRFKIYEVLFLLFFWVSMLNTQKIAKGLFTTGFILCFASCFDKILLDIHSYLLTDILVLIVAIIIPIYNYKNSKNVRQDR